MTAQEPVEPVLGQVTGPGLGRTVAQATVAGLVLLAMIGLLNSTEPGRRLAGIPEAQKQVIVPGRGSGPGPNLTKEAVQIMPSYEATGAGTAGVNGTFNPTGGTYNGKPSYTNGAFYLWWNSLSSRWVISGGEGGTPVLYNGTGADLPANAWSVVTGTAPAPSLAEAAPGLPEWDDPNFYGDAPFIPDQRIRPAGCTLGGVRYGVFAVDSATGQPCDHGFLLFNRDAGGWQVVEAEEAILPNGDPNGTATVADAGDGTHVWVFSGVYDDEGTPVATWRLFAVTPGVGAEFVSESTAELPSADITPLTDMGNGSYRFMAIMPGGGAKLIEVTP